MRSLGFVFDVVLEAVVLPLGFLPDLIGERAAKFVFVGAAVAVVGLTVYCVLTD